MKHQILIIGGGNAGISAASQLLRKQSGLDIAIVEPSEKHYYQPAWTLVGAGIYDIKDTEHPEASVMPKGVKWIKQRAQSFEPESNRVILGNGDVLSYDYLVVAPGIQINWDAIIGLKEAVGKNGVCSNYDFKQAPYTWECLKNALGGNILFTNPNTPIKCGGAPHKIMYLAADYFRKRRTLGKFHIQYWSAGSRMFGVEKYEKTLLEVIERGNIKTHFKTDLVEIDGLRKRARFEYLEGDMKGTSEWVNYEMIHVTPPQSAPNFVRNSSLANAAGWVDVDKNTLQHVRFANVFSLGDAAGLPTAKTGAAIRKQVPVLVENLLHLMKQETLNPAYDGYSSCPLVTGYGKVVMAEFDYDNKPKETFPFDQSKERYSMYFLKRYMLPWMYWNQILPGKM
jgi:sulfide:quinone oxidoreductase